MKIYFLFYLFGIILSNDIIFVGDIRMQEMLNILFGMELSTYTFLSHRGYCIMSTESISYEGFEIQGTTTDYLNSLLGYGLPNESLNKQLKNAEDGTNIFFKMSIKDLYSVDSIIIYCGKIADKYPNLNFYVISLVGVKEDKTDIKNSDIREFNKIMENRITLAEFPNMKYKSILYNDDPTQVVVNNQVYDILNYTTDGIGFFKAGYQKIFAAMVEGL